MAKTTSSIRSRPPARKKVASPVIPATNRPCVCIEEELEIPLGIDSLDRFREWALSGDFPEKGRIDYVNGRIEVDMSPEDLFCHGTVKGKIYAVLLRIIEEEDLGSLFIDCTRVSSPKASISVEPDIVFLPWNYVDDGIVQLTPKRKHPERFVEIVGPTALIVEVISDSSVKKDQERLPPAYFKAGVEELWMVDARGSELRFDVMVRGKRKFDKAGVDREGFQLSLALGRRFRLQRKKDRRGFWRYDLFDKPA